MPWIVTPRKALSRRPPRFHLDRDHPLSTGLVFAGLGQYPGSTLYRDASLVHNDGTLTNMDPASDWVLDRELERQRLDFDGTQYANRTFPFLTAPFTLSTWMLTTEVSAVANYRNIMARGAVFENDTNFAFGWRRDARSIFCYWRNGATPYGAESDPSVAPEGAWWRITAVIDPSWNLTLYVASQAVKTDGSNSAPSDGSQPLRIGGANSTTSNDLNFLGSLSDPCIWSRALTPAEIALLASRNSLYGGWVVPEPARVWFVGGGGGGTSWTRSATEGLLFADLHQRTAPANRLLTVAAPLADLTARLSLAYRQLTEALQFADLTARQAAAFRSLVEGLPLASLLDRTATIGRTVTAALPLADLASRQAITSRAFTEALALADDLLRATAAYRLATEAVELGDWRLLESQGLAAILWLVGPDPVPVGTTWQIY